MRFAVAAMVALLAALCAAAAAAAASRPLTFAIIEPPDLSTGQAPAAFTKMRAAGVSAVRTTISWYTAAPANKPDSWDPANPDDPHYDWKPADARMKL